MVGRGLLPGALGQRQLERTSCTPRDCRESGGGQCSPLGPGRFRASSPHGCPARGVHAALRPPALREAWVSGPRPLRRSCLMAYTAGDILPVPEGEQLGAGVGAGGDLPRAGRHALGLWTLEEGPVSEGSLITIFPDEARPAWRPPCNRLPVAFAPPPPQPSYSCSSLLPTPSSPPCPPGSAHLVPSPPLPPPPRRVSWGRCNQSPPTPRLNNSIYFLMQRSFSQVRSHLQIRGTRT